MDCFVVPSTTSVHSVCVSACAMFLFCCWSVISDLLLCCLLFACSTLIIGY